MPVPKTRQGGLLTLAPVLVVSALATPALGQSVSTTETKETRTFSHEAELTPLSATELARSNAWGLSVRCRVAPLSES